MHPNQWITQPPKQELLLSPGDPETTGYPVVSLSAGTQHDARTDDQAEGSRDGFERVTTPVTKGSDHSQLVTDADHQRQQSGKSSMPALQN